MYMYLYYLGTYVPSTVDFPITNGDKGFGFSNPYEGNYFFQLNKLQGFQKKCMAIT